MRKGRLDRCVASVALVVLVGCGGGGAGSAPVPIGTSVPTIAPSSSPVPTAMPSPVPTIAAPSSGAYLGAYVDPYGGQNVYSIVTQTGTFESKIGRTLALHLHYYDWSASTGTAALSTVATDVTIKDDMKHGRIPILSWRCGASLTDIANGVYDSSVLVPTAQAIASLHYPVFLRFFWEFNLDMKGEGTNGDSPSCFDTSGNEPSQFVHAWEHVHDVFVANGATNVTWLWCPDGRRTLNLQALTAFVPPHTDWIGVDAYDKLDIGFENVFKKFYGIFSSYSQPLMIAETGELSNASPYTQAQYYANVDTLMPTVFPRFKAFVTFDGAVSNTPFDWILNAGGLTSFTTLATDPYFSPKG